jgi:hypothetical protein
MKSADRSPGRQLAVKMSRSGIAGGEEEEEDETQRMEQLEEQVLHAFWHNLYRF